MVVWRAGTNLWWLSTFAQCARRTMSAPRCKQVTQCRVSGSSHLVGVLDLGVQALTGVFPGSATQPVTSGPLQLVWCPDSGLLQLSHSYDSGEMYGENYGY